MNKNSNKHWLNVICLVLLAVILVGCQGQATKTKKSETAETSATSQKTAEKTTVDWPYYAIKKDGDVIGHILGTMHVGKKEMYPFPEQMLTDATSSSLLVTEVKMKELLEPNMDLLMTVIQGEQPLTEEMSEDSLKLYRKRLKEYGFTEKELENLNRFGVDQFLQTKYFSPMAASYGVETQLYGKVKHTKGLKNVGFETVGEQYGILLATYDEPKDVNDWVKLIPTVKEGTEAIDELMASYINGEVFDYFTEEKMTALEKAQMDVLIDQRNENWLTILPSYLEVEKGVFVAVGAGHLPGEKGVLNLLEEKGYQTEKVTFD